MSAADDLIRKNLDGITGDQEQKELDRLLAGSAAAADEFARAARLDQALDRHYHSEQAIGSIQHRIRALERRRWILIASVAAAFLLAISAFFVLRGSEPLAYVDGAPLHELAELSGPAALTFPGESTR